MPYRSTYNLSDKQKAEAIADEFIERGIGMGGGGGGGGDASAANQLTEINRLESIRDRIPTALVGDRLKVDLPSIPSGENFIGSVGGRTVLVQSIFARPADTTAYAIGDSVSNSTSAPSVIEFTGASRVASGSGIVVGARMVKSSASTTNASFRLWLYTATSSNVNDNAPRAITFANRAIRLGYIDLVSPIAGSDCCEFIGQFPNSQYAFKLASSTSLFGKLEARGAYAPASAEQFFIELSILLD